MRIFGITACLVAALALVVYGMLQPFQHDSRWITALWLSAPLFFIVARLALPLPAEALTRSVQNLGLVIAVCVLVIALQLLHHQFVYADAISRIVHIDPATGQTTSNVRQVIESMRAQRGRMFDRDDVLLVDTRVVDGGFAVRTYPLAQLFDSRAFGNLTGFFSSRFGQSGLELTYDDYLNGSRDRYGQIQDVLVGRAPVGDDLRLTIDAQLQDAAWKALAGRTGSVVVLDPTTGAVLAMVSNPGFDPAPLAFDPSADREAENTRIDDYWRLLNSEGAGQPLINRPTQGRYPPGSTFKTVTAIAALEFPAEGRPNEIDCPEFRDTEAGAPPVRNAVPNLRERIGDPASLERVFAYSCNTAFAEYAMRLYDSTNMLNRLEEVAGRFDFFAPGDEPETYSGFTDLPTLPSLLYVDPGFLNRRAAQADTGYGQGQVLATPVQMAMVAASVANDGILMRPFLVQRVTRPDGSTVVAQAPRALRRVISPVTAATMRADMRAVGEYGFGSVISEYVPGVTVGGKSGTAEHGPGRTPHAWFIAVAPIEQPRFAIAVMVEDGGEGSSVGAQLAGKVLAAAFKFVE